MDNTYKMTGIELITEERMEQLNKHGWNPKHDDAHNRNELIDVAVCLVTDDFSKFPKYWDYSYKKKLINKEGVEALKVAGALIAAEIDRLQRKQNDNASQSNCTIHSVKNWLLTRKWLWRKVVFDNGVAGRKYHRYDHIILPYVQGMGDNGKHGDVDTAIRWQLDTLNRACS